jgi:hypothetical protein
MTNKIKVPYCGRPRSVPCAFLYRRIWMPKHLVGYFLSAREVVLSDSCHLCVLSQTSQFLEPFLRRHLMHLAVPQVAAQGKQLRLFL